MTKYNEIFLAVIGITPQVLTECLYYYYSDYYKQKRRFDRIKVFTTLDGQSILIDKLFKGGKLHELEKSLKLQKGVIPFEESDIILFTDSKGAPIRDMRTTEDNEGSLNLLHNELKRLTSDSSTRVTATVAGGRKTMGAQMALAFQLYAREHDELIHIIAPDEKMDPKNPESQSWFFPIKPADPSEKLDVSHVPIIRVGRYLSASLDLPPVELIDKLQSELVEQAPIEELIIDGRNFISGDDKIILPANEAAYLRFFIKRRINSNCNSNCKGCESCFITNSDLLESAQREVLFEHEIVAGKYSGYLEKAKETRLSGFTVESLNGHISSLDKKLLNSTCSKKLINQLRLKKIQIDPDDLRIKAKGIIINSEVVEFIN